MPRHLIALLFALGALSLAAQSAVHDSAGSPRRFPGERLGTVSFSVSCSPEVRAPFSRGVALLHDFWYEEAQRQFERIAKADPECAMAHWGIAMSGFHQIWDRPDEHAVARGWAEMQAAGSPPAKSAREREYIAALSGFFRPDKREYQSRIEDYAAAMAKLYRNHPRDTDAGAFYALSLLAAEAPDDANLTLERKALAILNPLFAEYPDHPGIVHYIIHACDTPMLAPDGLAAAKHYGEIAASAPHAVHMPGHIFARLGMWQPDIESNLGSVAASKAAESRHQSGAMDQFHSDEFLLYAYLQTAQDDRAKALLADAQASLAGFEAMGDMGEHYMEGMFPYYRTKLPAFFHLEMRDWKSAAALEPVAAARPETQTMTYWARTVAAGHLRRPQQARSDLATYESLLEKVRQGRHAYVADSTGTSIQRGEMLGWTAFAEGNSADALKRMRESADLQDKVGQGEVDIPAREMLADMLLELSQPAQALIEYKQALALSPNRFNGLYNAGAAAEAAGDAAQARSYFAALLKSTDSGAHSARPEFEHAKAYAASTIAMSAAANNLTLERIFADPSLAGPAPRGVKVAPDSSRVALLRGRATDGRQLDLWTYDVGSGRLELRVDSAQLAPQENLSDAERARRERERTADYHGIVDYDWAPDGHHVLFTIGGYLYLYDLDAPPNSAVRRLTQTAHPLIDPQMSPLGRYVSFVRDQDLWVIDLRSGEERRLTADGGGTVHNAEAEFVAQEEMRQTSGYWWAPDDSAIAYKRFDESAVPIARRIEVYPDRTDVIEQRYPFAGTPNVAVKLGVVAPIGGNTRWVDLGSNQDIYLPRADWTPDSRRFAFQRLTRDQHRLDLILVDAVTLRETQLLSETSPVWVNLSDDLRFLKKQRSFIWSSERSGTNHLYLYDLAGRLRHALTLGAWNVDGLLAVDESAGLVYLSSNRNAVIDRQIYAARLDGRDAENPRRISRGDGWHSAQFARQSRRVGLYVDTYSDSHTPPQVSVNAPDGQRVAWIEANALDNLHPYWPYHDRHAVPEFGRIRADDGQDLQYSLMKPQGFDSTRRYPVFLSVYGGPSVQNVRCVWPSMIDEYMAQQGYVVFILDNRGSARRSRAFQDPIRGRLGEVEVRDQLAGVHWLQSLAWIDAKRIGVFGWSYGGYMTLMLLAKGSDAIAAGAAVAPVTDWRLYDTAYTERYLGLPTSNGQGYADSSVFSALDGLKSPLLLAHGMADDNVLFVNSTRLMSELQHRGVQFELMTYPGAKHGLSTPQMKVHVYTAIRDFFDRRVKGDQ